MFISARTTKAFEHLGCIVLVAALGKVQCMAKELELIGI
jgi:hypothetical protein